MPPLLIHTHPKKSKLIKTRPYKCNCVFYLCLANILDQNITSLKLPLMSFKESYSKNTFT